MSINGKKVAIPKPCYEASYVKSPRGKYPSPSISITGRPSKSEQKTDLSFLEGGKKVR